MTLRQALLAALRLAAADERHGIERKLMECLQELDRIEARALRIERPRRKRTIVLPDTRSRLDRAIKTLKRLR